MSILSIVSSFVHAFSNALPFQLRYPRLYKFTKASGSSFTSLLQQDNSFLSKLEKSFDVVIEFEKMRYFLYGYFTYFLIVLIEFYLVDPIISFF